MLGHFSAQFINLTFILILTSKNILIVDDPKGQNQPCYKELENEGFSISIINSVEEALNSEEKPQLIILDSKLNGECSESSIEKLKTKNVPIILCSEWGKDKLSFSIWASEVNVVKSGDYRDLKLSIKEILS